MAKKVPPGSALPSAERGSALDSLHLLETQLTTLQDPVVKNLQTVLDGLRNQSFGSLEANQAVIDAIQRLLHRFDLRVACPRCGEPAIPRCRATRHARDGSFQFEHTRGHKTNHGGSTTIPAFRLVPAPPDRRRERKNSQ